MTEHNKPPTNEQAEERKKERLRKKGLKTLKIRVKTGVRAGPKVIIND